MDLSRLQSVYAHEGPIATVCLEGRSPAEDSGEQLRKRWKQLRERLSGEGATSGALQALDGAVEQAQPGEEQANGRVLVASEHGLALDEPWDAALGSGDQAHCSELFELGAPVREECGSVRLLVVLAKHQGAQIRQGIVAEEHVARDVGMQNVTGSSERDPHKPRGGALAPKQIERRAEQAQRRNAEDVVKELRTLEASFRPRVIALAGEVQDRTTVRDALPEGLVRLCMDIDRDDDQDEAAEQALAEQLRHVAEEERTRSAQSRTEQLHAGLAHERAVRSTDQVAQAAEMGAVETLLLEHDVAADREASLIKVSALGSARVDLVERGTDLTDGVGQGNRPHGRRGSFCASR